MLKKAKETLNGTNPLPFRIGASGSPVLNNKGEVIGIATLIFTKKLNFVVPSYRLIALKETGKLSEVISVA